MRLLLAEDEKELAKALAAILKHNNYSVDTVYNGVDALEYLKTDIYDGAIIDIMMPMLDGLSVIKEARKQGIGLPIIILTARSDVDDRVEGLDSGADDYLTKPFATKELLARIRAMLRRKEGSAVDTLVFGNLELDLVAYTLSTPTSTVSLANKEFQMMEFLMSNPGRLISSSRFMEKIWGYDSETEQNVVWVYISYLRKKLVSIGANVSIKASRNLGYCLEVIE